MEATPTARDAAVALTDVEMAFDDRPVLRGLTCSFPRGKISVVLGGSGAGKTTILRVIGGLVRHQKGKVVVAGQDISAFGDSEMNEIRRKIGMMFQGGALLDSLTVFDNLALPLREHTKLGAKAIADEVHKQLSAVGLSNVDGLLPGQLSGGMIKRAALARAMITKPEILMCDEPFSGLDPISVKRIEALLRRVNRELGITMLIASHHIPSTLRLADQVLLLQQDHMVVGTPEELRTSSDRRIAEFLNEEVDEALVDEDMLQSIDPERAPQARHLR
jgi:phospholipid/cholesterol/gamma-HCH transport system ATP-binding protein